MGRRRARGGPESAAWRTWHVPLSRTEVTLADGYRSLQSVGMGQRDVPLIVQMVENPRFELPGIEIFSGAADLRKHDLLHIVLGRGLLPKDEAFVLGFTMGSTNRVGGVEETLFTLIARYLYPKTYRFGDEEVEVYKDAVRLAYISDCEALATVNLESMLEWPLGRIRAAAGIEEDLLRAYYGIEARRFPQSAESQRLLA